MTKYGHESNYFFSEKISSYWPFWGTIECSFDRLDAFWPIMCMTEGRFSYTIWKKWHESTVFWENGHFFTTYYGHESYVFLENGLFFLTKYERESSDFFIKKHGKRACYCLFWPIEYSSFNRIGFFFFDQLWAWQQGVFHEKVEIMTWEHRVFERIGVFLTKYGNENRVFLENRRFKTEYWN